MNNSKLGRRSFIRRSATVAAAIPLGAIPMTLLASGSQVSEDDPAAAALGYKHDASTVDAAKYPQHKDGQLCSNCKLYTADADSGWGACGIFPGKQVNGDGWCAAWVTAG
jgi:hypothetical protein